MALPVIEGPELARGYASQNADQHNAGVFLASRIGAIRPGARVLDVGCGTGNLTVYLASLVGFAGSVVGIDPSPERIAVARKTYNSSLVHTNLLFDVGHAEDLGRFADADFDVVFVNSVLHWVKDQGAAMREFARVLKSSGQVGISGGSGDQSPAPAHEHIKELVLGREEWAKYPDPTGGPRFLKRAELEGLLGSAGFAAWDISVNTLVKRAKDSEEVMDWLVTSSSGATYGGVPRELWPDVRREMTVEWEKLRTDEGVSFEIELYVTVATK